jgi:hypothetical protein
MYICQWEKNLRHKVCLESKEILVHYFFLGGGGNVSLKCGLLRKAGKCLCLLLMALEIEADAVWIPNLQIMVFVKDPHI